MTPEERDLARTLIDRAARVRLAEREEARRRDRELELLKPKVPIGRVSKYANERERMDAKNARGRIKTAERRKGRTDPVVQPPISVAKVPTSRGRWNPEYPDGTNACPVCANPKLVRSLACRQCAHKLAA